MLKIENISFAYGDTEVIKNVSIDVKLGENLAVIGESGSGKSTLLDLIYGKFDLLKGVIFWKEIPIQGPAYNLVIGYDFMKYVSQEFDLMPFTTVEENVGKHLSNFYPKEKKQRTKQLLEVVELECFSNIKVKNLSGGQMQRVALARALAKEPQLLLLDEPFSHIDNFKKQKLRRKLFKYLKQNAITCLVATHDKNDVLGFADRVAVLENGSLQLTEETKKLYNHPKTELVASFFGEYNELPKNIFPDLRRSESPHLIYAHQLRVVPESSLEVTVDNSYFNGQHYLVEGSYEDKSILFYHDHELEKGTRVYLDLIAQ